VNEQNQGALVNGR